MMTQKSQGSEDLAFMVEYLLAEMKRTPSNEVPVNHTRPQLIQAGGPICLAQISRQTVLCLLKNKRTPPTWAPYQELVEQLAQPSTFLKLFPPGDSIPENTTKLLAPCPSSLKHASSILKFVHGGGSPPGEKTKWNEKVKSFCEQTNHQPGMKAKVSEQKLEDMLCEVFEELWIAFKACCDGESGKPPSSKEGNDDTNGKPEEEVDCQTTPMPPEPSKLDEVRQAQLDVASRVYTDPGILGSLVQILLNIKVGFRFLEIKDHAESLWNHPKKPLLESKLATLINEQVQKQFM